MIEIPLLSLKKPIERANGGFWRLTGVVGEIYTQSSSERTNKHARMTADAT
jgi:hypothetical protein